MKVKIGDNIYDSNEEPIMLIFENDEERKATGNHIQNMENKDGIRKYVSYPSGGFTTGEIKTFMKI